MPRGAHATARANALASEVQGGVLRPLRSGSRATSALSDGIIGAAAVSAAAGVAAGVAGGGAAGSAASRDGTRAAARTRADTSDDHLVVLRSLQSPDIRDSLGSAGSACSSPSSSAGSPPGLLAPRVPAPNKRALAERSPPSDHTMPMRMSTSSADASGAAPGSSSLLLPPSLAPSRASTAMLRHGLNYASAFGNTLPRARLKVLGLRERGKPSDGTFRAMTGEGYVAAVPGDYDWAIRVHGVDVRVLLFESFGGFSPDVVHLMRDLAEERQNRLNKAEYELTTWAARTWLSFSAQKISVCRAAPSGCARDRACPRSLDRR